MAEELTDKGLKVFKNARRSRSLAAELYRLRCEFLATTQVANLERGEKQQPILLQGVTPLEVVTIESFLQTYEKHAERRALVRAKRRALAVANEPELMTDGAENPIALKIFAKIQALLDELDKEDDEDGDEQDDAKETVKVEFAVAAEPPPAPAAPEPPAADNTTKGTTKP